MNIEEDRVNWKEKKYSSELSTIIEEKEEEELMDWLEGWIAEMDIL